MLPPPPADHLHPTTTARNSSAARTHAGGLSILDSTAWQWISPYSWTYGIWTICAVKYRGDLTYELWRKSDFCARDRDAKTLRVVAAAGGAVA